MNFPNHKIYKLQENAQENQVDLKGGCGSHACGVCCLVQDEQSSQEVQAYEGEVRLLLVDFQPKTLQRTLEYFGGASLSFPGLPCGGGGPQQSLP